MTGSVASLEELSIKRVSHDRADAKTARCDIAVSYQWHCTNLILLMVTQAYIQLE